MPGYTLAFEIVSKHLNCGTFKLSSCYYVELVTCSDAMLLMQLYLDRERFAGTNARS